jgi:uncharacterized protein (DUF1778 family)
LENSATKAKEKYNAKTYEDIRLRVKAGEKAIIETYAAEHELSLNGFITQAIKTAMGVSN